MRPLSQLRPQPEAIPGQTAGVVAGLAGATHVGADTINPTCGRYADLAHQRGAAVPIAANAAQPAIDELGRDAIEIGVVLRTEARPLLRKGAAGAAAPANRIAV
jgi:hypothetical protein